MDKPSPFLSISDYQLKDGYVVLPFRFNRLNDGRELIVNDLGDFIIASEGTVEKIIENRISPSRDLDLYFDLLSKFIITQHDLGFTTDVLALRTRSKLSHLDSFTQLHIFVLTLRCEHTCNYCQVSRVTSGQDNHDMSSKHLDLAIEHMLRSPAPHVTMEFQGGETLLAFDLVKRGVLKAKEKAAQNNKRITFVICTNLSLIDEEKLLFLKEHSVLVSTSLDGPEFIHNNNRHVKDSSSFAATIKGIQLAKHILGNDNVSALMTTTDLTLKHPDEIVDEYYRHGFRNLFLRPISPYGFALRSKSKNRYDMERFMEFYKKALDRILWYNKNGHFFAESFSCIFLKKILTPFPVGFVDIMSPTGSITKAIVFNYDGYVYASDESRMLAEMNDFTFRIGHLDTEDYNELFYGDKAYSIVEETVLESQPGCSDCALLPYCGSDPVYNHATQSKYWGYKPQSGYCHRNMGILNHLFHLMEDPENKRIFESWISLR